MANSDVADLMGLGRHCAVKMCNKLDFLPFQCKKCHDIFCLEHRNEKDHKCPNSTFGDTRVPVCPLCSQPVSVSRSRGEDVNSQVERHITSGCRDHVVSTSSQRRSVATSCPHRGCKRRDLVPYTCPQCARVVCIRHRHPMDHACQSSIISVH